MTGPGYELVAGLEVHVELKTRTKIFCGCPTAFGAPPNTQCCPVCMGMPGALPVLNGRAVEYAIRAGLAMGCRIAPFSRLARKHYFYPDLPKAYQISQYELPLCQGGGLTIRTPAGEKRIGITRIHIEEDAGKLLHQDQYTLIDFNRCGVPLIEIVSQPDIRSPQEAVAYLRKLRSVIAYTDVSDCKMNEGSLRCDVNLSLHRPGEPLGQRVEIKNLNSFLAVQRAMEAEYRRQAAALDAGEGILPETRRFDQAAGRTLPMRAKESAEDYRYFPDPDLPPVTVTPEELERIAASIPRLPDERQQDYQERYGITPYGAEQLAAQRQVAECFEAACGQCAAPQALCNLILGEVFRLLPGEDAAIPIAPGHLARLADMAAAGEINNNAAKQAVAALWQADQDPEAYIAAQGLYQLSDPAALEQAARQAMARHPELVAALGAGKEKVRKALMGAAMGLTGGKANPVLLERILNQALENRDRL